MLHKTSTYASTFIPLYEQTAECVGEDSTRRSAIKPQGDVRQENTEIHRCPEIHKFSLCYVPRGNLVSHDASDM